MVGDFFKEWFATCQHRDYATFNEGVTLLIEEWAWPNFPKLADVMRCYNRVIYSRKYDRKPSTPIPKGHAWMEEMDERIYDLPDICKAALRRHVRVEIEEETMDLAARQRASPEGFTAVGLCVVVAADLVRAKAKARMRELISKMIQPPESPEIPF